MDINNFQIVKKILPIILRAQAADANGLKSLRNDLIKILDEIGPRRFVTVAADILKNNFKVEGCNDARMPLKRIFSIPLEELKEALAKKTYVLPKGHPILLLSEDHKDNIQKLEALKLSLDQIKKEWPSGRFKDNLKMLQDYYAELDIHIRKEEEALFPALEENGMHEHPQNLRDEHKGFKEILSRIGMALEGLNKESPDSQVEEIKNSKDKFISDISNHIFREAFIFYPAALEFITQSSQWEKIKEDFSLIK